MRKPLIMLSLLAIVMLFTWSGLPDWLAPPNCAAKAREAFKKKYPNYSVLTSPIPDGSTYHDTLSHGIHYKKPDDERTYFGAGAAENMSTGECRIVAEEQSP